MRSDKASLSTVEDALGLAAANTDTAYTGLNSSIDVLTQIKDKLVIGRGAGAEKSKINAEITELKNELITISEAASFSGQNWLHNSDSTPNGTIEMVGSFNRSPNGEVSVGVVKFDTATSTLIDTQNSALGLLTKDTAVAVISGGTTTTASYYLLDVNAASAASGMEIALGATTSYSDIDGMISAVDAMLMSMTHAAANLGAASYRINLQHDFVADLIDTNDKGVGKLVDADMNEASTKLKALQTQQQLGLQSLSIANANSTNILQVFRSGQQ
jgi:flagellin